MKKPPRGVAMQTAELEPSDKQKRFFEDYILGEMGTILTLKSAGIDNRGFSVNIRGPFKLVQYDFPTHSETVIDAEWAGLQESNSHMHCCWTEVQFAKLTRTNRAVQENIGYEWQVSFYASSENAISNRKLFWFYLESEKHKAVQKLKEGLLVEVA
jgi:hypothetical protein